MSDRSPYSTLRRLCFPFCAGALFGLAFLAIVQRETISALREQVRTTQAEPRKSDSPQTVETDAQQLRNRESEIEQLRAQIKDLARLRNEVRQLREQNQQLEALRQANAKLMQAIQAAGVTQPEATAMVASARRQGAFLGVSITTANPADPTGVIVQSIHPDSRAAQSHLMPGDVIFGLDGDLVKTVTDLQTEMLTKKPGQKSWLEVMRDGVHLQIEVETTAWPE